MRITEEIPITSIVCNDVPCNFSVLSLVFFLLGGGEIPPIHVQKSSNGYLLLDGRHRYAAYKLLGYDKINAKFSLKEPGINIKALAVAFGYTIEEMKYFVKKHNLR
jgi:uncharacterized ParB-like nuclease family protein